MDPFDSAWMELKARIAAHWKGCEEAGLPHRSGNRDQVVAAFETFISTEKTQAGQGDAAVLTGIRELYATLDAINAANDMALLETDERELLVPSIIRIAQMAGVDPSRYDGEPGGEFRNF